MKRVLTMCLAASFLLIGYIAGPASAQQGTTQVNIVGDSITNLTAPHIPMVFQAPNWSTDVIGVPGVWMAGMLPTIEQMKSQVPTDWVVELGTNDAGNNNPNWWSAFWNEVNALQNQQCVVMVTVSTRAQPIAGAINLSIYYATLLHPQFHALDWGDLEYTNPDWVEPDQIHPTRDGRMELAQLMKQAVRQNC